MRIAQVIAGAPTGGAELFFERLTIALSQAGETVLPVIRRDAARAARLAHAGVPARQMAFGGPLDPFTTPRLARVLRGFAPDLAVAWMGRAARHAPVGDWVLAGRLGGHYDLSRFARCDHLIGNTRGVVDWIAAQGWPAARLHHAPNFSPDLAGAAPASLGLPLGAKLVLALGRLHRNKAFDVLIRAIARLPRAHLALAGDGPERAALRRLASGAGVGDRVHFLGWRTDTAALLAAASVLACPSRQEPLGNVVIEAWSAFCPVVACASAGPAELVTSGIDGLLTPLEDDEALADALGAVLGDFVRARGLAAAGRARYEAAFAPRPVLGRWQSLLATLEKA